MTSTEIAVPIHQGCTECVEVKQKAGVESYLRDFGEHGIEIWP